MDTFLQDFQSLTDLISDSVYCKSQFFSYFLVLEAIALAQDEYLTTLFWKTVNCGPKTGLGLRTLLSVVIVNDSVGVVWFEGFGRDTFLAEIVKTAVAHHHI